MDDQPGASEASEVNPAGSMGLVKGLGEVEKLRQLKNYEEAEARLKSLLQEFPGDAPSFHYRPDREPLGAGLTDDDLQSERLTGPWAIIAWQLP